MLQRKVIDLKRAGTCCVDESELEGKISLWHTIVMQSNNVTVWSYLKLVAIFDFDAHRLLTLLA